jgi:hypothetical protein
VLLDSTMADVSDKAINEGQWSAASVSSMGADVLSSIPQSPR